MSFLGGYTPNYFSIDDILATQERTPIKFTMHVPKLGSTLNPSSEEADIKIGTSLELPIWLITQIATGRQALAAADLPKVYKEGYREILKADPQAVDLHKFGLYFYELGNYVKVFDNKGDVNEILMHTFTGRVRKIMDLAENVASNPSVQDTLDTLERKLFRDGHKARSKLNNWLVESGVPLEASNMVINHKKRKRVDIEDVLL
ncbi:DNA replication complex GINS protein PSF3 [Onthophagus taurus]|uniref:DNA replication complex GINS protein PSF3 n=1 Tax=Onthophagus taurus TaxID=166361 RepID=UPI0039BE4D2A